MREGEGRALGYPCQDKEEIDFCNVQKCHEDNCIVHWKHISPLDIRDLRSELRTASLVRGPIGECALPRAVEESLSGLLDTRGMGGSAQTRI